jgi:hypothetical protein
MADSDSEPENDVFSQTRRPAGSDGTGTAANNAAAANGGGPSSPSPRKGAGALLKAASPRGQPGSSKDRKDPATGQTIVEVVAYEKFDSNREYGGLVEKSAKYSGKWVPRYITLRDIDLSFSMNEGQTAKDTIRLHKVVRGAEIGKEPYSLVLEGMSSKDNKKVEFTFKVKTPEEAELWYLRFAHAMSAANMMDMPRQGLPLSNPRTGLPFTHIPLEHLAVFAPLDRLVLHFFAAATHKYNAALGRMAESPAFVFIGDLCVYVCDPKADIKRCISIRQVTGLLTVSAGTGPWTVGLQCSLPEYDLMFTMAAEHAEKFASVLSTLHDHFGVSKKAAKDTQPLKRQKLAKEGLLVPQLSLDPSDFYELKIRLPMSARYLQKMVADGVAAGHLFVKPSIVSLATPLQPGTAKGAAGTTANAANSSGVSATGPAKANAANANPLDVMKGRGSAPPPPMSDDSDTEGSKPKPAGASAAPAAPPPPPTKGDFDSDDDDRSPTMKASPLAGAFGGGSTQTRTEKTSAPGPSPSTSGGAGSGKGKVQVAMGVDKMHRMLNTIGLSQYYAILTDRGVDWEVFSCMDALDLKRFGVMSVEHQIKIENALNDPALMEALKHDSGGSSSFGAPPPPPPPPAPAASSAPTTGGKKPLFIDDDDL